MAAGAQPRVPILGVDFTSRPTRRKPITVARGVLEGEVVAIARVDRVDTLEGFADVLAAPGPWVGAFDFPFGLPRELIETLRWPGSGSRARRFWPRLVRHYVALDRAEIGRLFDRFRVARPIGRKYAHRATEALAQAHSAMKLVNPPVAWMMHVGAPLLLRAGVHIPGMRDGDQSRVAVEAYPGWLMRLVAAGWGDRRAPPYKNDSPRRRRPAHRDHRVRLLWALVEGEHPLALRLDVPVGLAAAAVEDGSGDTLDALAAAVQAGWAAARAGSNFGLPRGFDPLEGWIVGAGATVDREAVPGAPPSASGKAARRRAAR